MHLERDGTPLKAILAEIRSPTNFWGYSNQSGWGQSFFFGNDTLEIIRFREGYSDIVSHPKIYRIRRNNVEIPASYELSPIDDWFWLFIEFTEVISPGKWLLGIEYASFSPAWRNDFDLRHFLAWENTPTDAEVEEVIAWFT